MPVAGRVHHPSPRAAARVRQYYIRVDIADYWYIERRTYAVVFYFDRNLLRWNHCLRTVSSKHWHVLTINNRQKNIDMSLIENEEERLNNMWASIIVIGTIMVLVGVGIALFSRMISKSLWLKQHGTRIIARVASTAFVPGGGTSKMITAQWTDSRTEQTYTCRS